MYFVYESMANRQINKNSLLDGVEINRGNIVMNGHTHIIISYYWENNYTSYIINLIQYKYNLFYAKNNRSGQRYLQYDSIDSMVV